MNMLLDMFVTFAKVGVMTFGGGYAMLPILQRELVEKRNWVTDEEIMDYFAIGQCTPGVIAVNTATFVGMKLRSIPGAVFATVGNACKLRIVIGSTQFHFVSFLIQTSRRISNRQNLFLTPFTYDYMKSVCIQIYCLSRISAIRAQANPSP